jgi:serine/threonine protein kinase
MENSQGKADISKRKVRQRIHDQRKRRRMERKAKREQKKIGSKTQEQGPVLSKEHVVEETPKFESVNVEQEKKYAELEEKCSKLAETVERLKEENEDNNKKFKEELRTEKLFQMKSHKAELPSIRSWDLKVDKKSIGKGSYGGCFAGSYGTLDVVIKELNHKTSLIQAQREAHFLRYMRHPNLPILIGTDFSKAPFKIVMPLFIFDGTPLNLIQALDEKKFKDNVRFLWLDILYQVTKAVSYLHTVKVLHNDIKSNNIVLHRKSANDKPIAVVIDFGKATFLEVVTKTNSLNKPRHIAPATEKSTASDIYSLGCVIKDTTKVEQMNTGDIQAFYRKCKMVLPEERPNVSKVFKFLKAMQIGLSKH